MSGWFNPEVEKRDHIDNLEYKEKDKEDRRMSSAWKRKYLEDMDHKATIKVKCGNTVKEWRDNDRASKHKHNNDGKEEDTKDKS